MTEAAPARVFVACTEAEALPMQVLAFSIRETCSIPVEVVALSAVARPIPRPAAPRNQPRTPFSFQRFLIPELCGFQGRAIYLDADMQVFSDIAALWNAPMDGFDLLAVREGSGGRRGQFSVMLVDCARLQWRVEDIVAGLDAGRYSYEELMQDMCVAPRVGRTLAPEWNSLEQHVAGATHLVHYTDMNTQPWVSLRNPLGPLWLAGLRRAIAAGAIARADLEQAVGQGHVRPSLLAQLDDASTPLTQLRALDREFVAPYRLLRAGKSRPWTAWRGALTAYGRRGLQRLRGLGRD